MDGCSFAVGFSLPIICEIYRQGEAVIEQDYTILCGA